MLSQVIETTCSFFHSPVKFLRNKHDKVATGKHFVFSSEDPLVHTQLEQNSRPIIHFMFKLHIQPILGSGFASCLMRG